MSEHVPTLVAFLGTELLARGPAAEVVLACLRPEAEPAPCLRSVPDERSYRFSID